MAAPQRFPLPNMPFRREVHSGCAVGTSITLKGQAFQAKEKSFTIQLSSAKDIAILVTVPLAKNGRITACARVDGKYTSEVDKPIFLPYQMKFTLHLRITQFVTEIYFNDNHLMDFVHRVSPTDIKEVHIEGPLIVEEVVFTPPQGSSLDPVPSYEQATNMGTDPIKEFRHLNIGPPTIAPSSSTSSVLIPTPAPPQIGLSNSVVNQPIAGVPLPNSENSPHYVPTAFEQAQRYSTPSSTASPYVTSPTPTPTATPRPLTPYSGASTMPVLQPTSFQAQPLQPTPYPSSSQALQPIPPAGPVANMPYPQTMPQPHAPNQPYPASVNPYAYQQQQYPYGVPGQQGMMMYPPYNPYQQNPNSSYVLPTAPYAAGLICSTTVCRLSNLLRIRLPSCQSRRAVQENSAEQSSLDKVSSKDQLQNSPRSKTTPQHGSSSNLDSLGANSMIEVLSPEQSTAQMLVWLEMMQLSVQGLSKDSQAVQRVLEENPLTANNQEFAQLIRAELPRLSDVAKNPEVTSSLKNPRILAAVRNIQFEMDTIRREAPILAELLKGGFVGRSRNAAQGEGAQMSSTSSVRTSIVEPLASIENGGRISPDPELLYLQYEVELDQLAKMGFLDKAKSLAAIRASDGNIEGAVDILCRSSAN